MYLRHGWLLDASNIVLNPDIDLLPVVLNGFTALRMSGPVIDATGAITFQDNAILQVQYGDRHGASARESTSAAATTSLAPLELLRSQTDPGYLHNAIDRFDAPRCDPDTRGKVLKILKDWVEDNDDGAAIMWLFGPAGTGKSAIAQTTTEILVKSGLHAGSFVFSKRGRQNGHLLIPTITAQLIQIFPSNKAQVLKVLQERQNLFEQTQSEQMQHLWVRSFKTKWYHKLLQTLRIGRPRARLIVIDGLDECENTTIQVDFIKVLTETLPQFQHPFRFLVVSRSEGHILNAFLKAKNIRFNQIDLGENEESEADESIKTFLQKSFQEIRSDQRFRQVDFPDDWPSDHAITQLVIKASGQFIFAATVVKYVGNASVHSLPVKRLDAILKLEPLPREHGEKDPYAELNSVYMHIFTSASKTNWAILHPLFGILYLSTLLEYRALCITSRSLECYLGMDRGAMIPLLSGFGSLLSVPADPDSPIKIYHISLFDFLQDPARSKDYHIDIRQAHHRLARYHMQYYKQPTTSGDRSLQCLMCLHHSEQAVFEKDDLFKYLEECPFLNITDNEVYDEAYLPFLYFKYFLVLEREEFQIAGELRFHSLNIETLTSKWWKRAGGSSLPTIDLGSKPLNGVHGLFAAYISALLAEKSFVHTLGGIFQTAESSLMIFESTAPTLKHVLLGALAVSQPSCEAYQVYTEFAQTFSCVLGDDVVDKAIRSCMAKFIKLPVPLSADEPHEKLRNAWTPLLER